MAITRVWIEPGCVVCHLSADTCPEVFEIPEPEETAVVKEGVDFTLYEKQIRDAAEGCPVDVIKFEEA